LKIIERLKNTSGLVFIIQTVIPFFIPFIFEIPDAQMSITIKVITVVLIAGIDLAIIYSIGKSDKEDEKSSFRNKAARIAYSNVYELNEIRRDYYINNDYYKAIVYPYQAQYYIKEIVLSFGSVISDIVGIEKEKTLASFVYHFTDEEEWYWATQKDGTMTLSLKEFVKKETTLYYQLTNPDKNGKLRTVIFINDKAKAAEKGEYYLSTRDNRHNNIGSMFGIKVAFSTNEKILVEGILVFSSYGTRFIDAIGIKDEFEFQQLIIDELFPCYQRMLETELGVLYHEREQKVLCANNDDGVVTKEKGNG